MKKYDIFNKAMRNRILGVAAFCFLYIVLALRPLSTELHLTPEWTEGITRVQGGSSAQETIPFKLGQNMGFFTPEGKITNLVTYPFKASISDSYYTSYSANNTSTDFFLPSGEKAGTIKEAGFPFFDEDRIYVFLPGGSSFVQCSSSGERQWAYESYCPVTAFSSSAGGTVAGFADGTLVSFTKDGGVDQKFQPGGSNFSVILGAGISKSGDTVACVCGQDQQRFVVAQKSGEHSKIIFHEYLEKASVKQELVKFNSKDNVVYYGYEGGLGVVDLEKMQSYKLPLNGHVVQIQENEEETLAFILSSENVNSAVFRNILENAHDAGEQLRLLLRHQLGVYFFGKHAVHFRVFFLNGLHGLLHQICLLCRVRRIVDEVIIGALREEEAALLDSDLLAGFLHAGAEPLGILCVDLVFVLFEQDIRIAKENQTEDRLTVFVRRQMRPAAQHIRRMPKVVL